MKLIADIGATKGAWLLSDGRTLFTPPFNASTMPVEILHDIVASRLLPWLNGVSLELIQYYGAGVVGPGSKDAVKEALRPLHADVVTVDSDMVGAARLLLGDTPGIACILGTGSNSCLYDGREIVDNVPALGYILGDEGSGASLGKRFVGDLFKRRYPAEVTEAWERNIGMEMGAVIERVYRKPGANTWLASLVPLIASLLHIPRVRGMVTDEFQRFFDRNIKAYDTDCHNLAFIGGVAFNFAPLLSEVAAANGYNIKRLQSSLIE
ncbi:MAG: hypothetical protein NC082_02700 [Clostridiales bacterium]|nr:hypothetical protein [Clostridiales bacterium]